MDSLENSILDCKDVRIEHRWFEIERLRSIVYWYPFYPRTVLGETSDDCCDPDRLITFEDDLSLYLFDLSLKSNDLETSESLKFTLFLNFLKLFNLISSDGDNNFRISKLSAFNLKADSHFLQYLNENCSLIDELTKDGICHF